MDELLKGAPKNWGKWGDEDEVGSLNYLTAEEVFRGVRHIKSGNVFTLQRLIGDPKGDPVWPGRTPAEKTMIIDESSWERDDAPQFPGGLHYADDKINAFLQGSTQYDALGHVWYGGQLWNGYDARSTIGGLDKASVAPIAERGVVGRGILLDMARFRRKENLDKAETFTHEDLMACAEAQGTKIEKHDILIIRTNFLKLFFDQGEKFYEGFCEPGLVYSPELVQWFQDMEIPNLVTGTALPLHCALMRNLGVTLTEICDLEKLASHCAEDGQYTFLYAAAPLKVNEASGSPVNPLAIK